MSRNLNVSDLKQYLYCPRVVWFRYCQPVHRPVTYKMHDGKSRGEHVAELEQRRSLKAYGLHTAHRSFEVWLDSDRLGLCGKVDMLIDTGSERVPVEFKDAQRVAANHRYQLAAYALLLEEVPGPPVRRGFVYLVPSKTAHEVVITPEIRAHVAQSLTEMNRMIDQEEYPAPTTVAARHRDCEYRSYCPDVA